jgi:HAE1 family hydrophobic/amphiphilic exporter-1
MAPFFIRRPIVAMVISILMVIIGVVAIGQLPVSLYPEIAPPEIMLQARYPGADALTLEQSVATPIEQQMTGVDKMLYMYSLNQNAGSQMHLRVNFDITTDPSTDQVLTNMRYSQAVSQLPQDVVNQGVTIIKSATSPLGIFVLYSPKGTYDPRFLANYAYVNINDPMTRVPGIGQVQIFGSSQYAVRLWVNPDTLAKLDITVNDVASALQAQNTVNPAGQLGGDPAPPGQGFTYTVRRRAASRAWPSSRTSSCGPSRTARWSASRTSRAWSSASRATSGAAGSTVSRAPSSPSTSCPAPTPSRRCAARRS